MKEQWRDIPEYEGYYQVSDLGNVKSVDRIARDGRALKGKSLKQHGSPYLTVKLSKNNITKTFTVHTLVAVSFLNKGSKINELVIDHIDNNKHNNKVYNLQLVTIRYNSTKDVRGKSEYLGVSWSKSNNNWRSSIMVNSKSIHLGGFDTEVEASEYYNNACQSIRNNTPILLKRKIHKA